MRTDSGATRSVWMETADVPAFAPLGEDIEVDVCVVGAGIAGLSTAYQVIRDGGSAAVLDDGPVGGGESCRTTAHLTSALDDRYSEIERMFGLEASRLAAESHSAAVDRIERIVAEENIDCDFARLDGYLFAPPGQGSELLKEEYEAARRAGLGVTWAERAPIAAVDTGACLRFARQGQFHPVKYYAGLARAISRHGGRIFGGTHVTGVEGGTPCVVTTRDGRRVTAGSVVVATNSPMNDRVAIHTKQAPYRTYVVAAHVPKGAVEQALFWDTLDPYHYVRIQPGDAGDVIIVGGEDHKTGQASDFDSRFERLEAWTRERWPEVGGGPFAYRWSGQVMEPVDLLGFVGRNPLDDEHVFIATGDSGNGMTHGTLAGILLADLIAGRDNPWAAVYDPGRVTVNATTVAEFAKENLNVAGQYAEWVTGGEVAAADEIKPGTGAVVREGALKVAVYRDDQGALHRKSAICTHLGCIVHFNALERSWDCPCHGSRFAVDGHVVNGPAQSDLADVDVTEKA